MKRMMPRPIVVCCLVCPIVVIVFFTSLLGDGQPTDMPVGIVDADRTAMSRAMVRQLDAMQQSGVAAYYDSPTAARHAMQRGEIYAFLHIPEGTTRRLLAARPTDIAFYYSSASLTAGSLLYKDLKTVCTLAAAKAANTQLAAKGLTEQQIRALLQPVVIDLHAVNNPAANYNIALSTMIIPGCIMLFVFLLTPYTLGMLWRNVTQRQWIRKGCKSGISHAASGGDSANGEGSSGGRASLVAVAAAVVRTLLPQTVAFTAVTYCYMAYIFAVLHFPHEGGVALMAVLGLLLVLAAQGFGVFVFALVPQLRMGLSVCCVLAVLCFSLAGAAFPVSAMAPSLQAVALLFPLRHYYMVYQIGIFNGYPLPYYAAYLLTLCLFAALPLLVLRRIRTAANEYVYLP